MSSAAKVPDADNGSQHPVQGWWAVFFAVLPVFAVVLFTSHSRAAEVPFALLALAAPIMAWRQPPGWWHDSGLRLLLVLFLCYWLPMLAALPDALDFSKSLYQTLVALRLPLAALSIYWLLATRFHVQCLYLLIAMLLVFWSVDALLQNVMGFDLFGLPDAYPRLSGVFAERYLRLGLYSALLLPFLLTQFQRRERLPLVLPALLLVGLVIILSGTRSGWIMLALSLMLWFFWFWRGHWRSWTSAALAIILLAGALGSYFLLPSVHQRVEQTRQVFSADEDAINQALSYRLPIWRTAVEVVRDHPWNGVGPRGFRAAYTQRAAADDYFIRKEGMGASHAHQLQLSILTETGYIGFTAFLLGCWIGWRSWRRLPLVSRCLAAAPMGALFLALFPLNSHVDAYASSSSVVFWWLLGVYLAAWRIAIESE